PKTFLVLGTTKDEIVILRRKPLPAILFDRSRYTKCQGAILRSDGVLYQTRSHETGLAAAVWKSATLVPPNCFPAWTTKMLRPLIVWSMTAIADISVRLRFPRANIAFRREKKTLIVFAARPMTVNLACLPSTYSRVRSL